MKCFVRYEIGDYYSSRDMSRILQITIIFLSTSIILAGCGKASNSNENLSDIDTQPAFGVSSSQQNTEFEGGEVFANFPSDFDEGEVVALENADEGPSFAIEDGPALKKTKKLPNSIQIVNQKKLRGNNNPEARRARGGSRLSLEKVKKLYNQKRYGELIRMAFSKNEKGHAFYKALAYNALAKSDIRNRSIYAQEGKRMLNRIASETKSIKLKEKSLLWLGIMELEFPDKNKNFFSRAYPLTYLHQKMPNSKVANDAHLYLAFFHEQRGDLDRALTHYYKLKNSNPKDVVYDYRINKFVSPNDAVNHYLKKLQKSNSIQVASPQNFGSEKELTGSDEYIFEPTNEQDDLRQVLQANLVENGPVQEIQTNVDRADNQPQNNQNNFQDAEERRKAALEAISKRLIDFQQGKKSPAEIQKQNQEENNLPSSETNNQAKEDISSFQKPLIPSSPNIPVVPNDAKAPQVQTIESPTISLADSPQATDDEFVELNQKIKEDKKVEEEFLFE